MAVALSTLTILTNCAGSSDFGTPTLQTAVPEACESILVTVPDPIDTAKIADSALALLAKYRQKLGLANGRIIKARSCFEGVRNRFEAGK